MAKKRKPSLRKTTKRKSVAKKASPGNNIMAFSDANVDNAESADALIDTSHDVRLRIITSSPKEDIEPEDLDDGMLLKENLDYQPANFVALNISLDEYVNDRDGSQHVTANDMANCKSVGDTTKMVKTKLHET